MTTHVHQFLCLKDNYGALIHDSGTGATAAIDAPDGEAVIAAAAAQGWKLTDLLDHPSSRRPHPGHSRPAGALSQAARRRSGQGGGAHRRRSTRCSSEGDFAHVGRLAAKVIETPGHTAGHIVYLFEEDEIAFVGDTLFSLGCGRVFETPYAVMWDSLVKLAALPGETQIYCGHEYTEANARFALTIEPDNAVLKAAPTKSPTLRAAGKPTLPTTIAPELATNPFLRAEEPASRRRSAWRAPIRRRCSRKFAPARIASERRAPPITWLPET